MATHTGTDRRRVQAYRPQLEWMEDRQLLAGLHLLPALLAPDSSSAGHGLTRASVIRSLHDWEHSSNPALRAAIDTSSGPDSQAGDAWRHELQAAHAERLLSASVADEFTGRHEKSETPRPDSTRAHPPRSEGVPADESNRADVDTSPPGPADARSRSPSLAHGNPADYLSPELWVPASDRETAVVPLSSLAADPEPASGVPATGFTLQPGRWLTSFLPFDPAVLDQAVQHFVDEVHQLGVDLGTGLMVHPEASAVMVLAGVGLAAWELRRRQRPERCTMQAAARDAATGAMPTILRLAAP